MSVSLEEPKNDWVVGVDPGLTGAVAIVTPRNIQGVWDMPVETWVRERQKTVDAYALHSIIRPFAHRIRIACVETQQVMTGVESRNTCFSIGESFGMVLGVMASFEIPMCFVRPAVWKPSLGLSRDKKESIVKAKEYFPDGAEYFTRVKDHNRAEAALIAFLGLRVPVLNTATNRRSTVNVEHRGPNKGSYRRGLNRKEGYKSQVSDNSK